MSFFNLTYTGRQNVFNELKLQQSESDQKQDGSIASDISSKYSTFQYKAPMVSNLKYQDLKTKHVRRSKEPNQLYDRPITCSQEIGWWTKDDPIHEKLPWTYVKKHVFPKSEMTSFCDKMSLTDKSFKMY